MACAPSEDSDQPGHPPSLIRVFACAQWVAKDPSFLHVDSEDPDQTGRMPRLIWVFTGRTCLLVLSWGSSYFFYTVSKTEKIINSQQSLLKMMKILIFSLMWDISENLNAFTPNEDMYWILWNSSSFFFSSFYLFLTNVHFWEKNNNK